MSIGDKRGLDKKGRRIYEKQYGEIPRGHHIHHKNGDHSDNSLDNLVLMKASDHLSWHSLKRLSEYVKKGWDKRGKWARRSKITEGPFVSVFNEDGSYVILPEIASINKTENK